MELLSIQQLMHFYSRQREVLSPITQAQVKQVGKEPHTMVPLSSKGKGLHGIAHHYFLYDSGVEIGFYCNDDKILTTAGEKLHKPLEAINDCNYTYYACLLTLLAYISEKPVSKLFICSMKEDNKVYYIQYKKVIAELLVAHFDKHYRPALEKKQAHKDQYVLL